MTSSTGEWKLSSVTADKELDKVPCREGQADADNHQLNDPDAPFSERLPQTCIHGPPESGAQRHSAGDCDPKRQAKIHQQECHHGTEGDHLAVSKVGESCGPKHQGQSDCRQSQKETKIQSVENSHEELIQHADGISGPLTDEKVLGDCACCPKGDFLNGPALEHSDSFGERVLYERDAVGSPLGNTNRPLTVTVGNSFCPVPVAFHDDAHTGERLALVLDISRDCVGVFGSDFVGLGRRRHHQP